MSEYKLFRYYPSGRCRDCQLFDGHSNACIDAAPLRKIDELQKELSNIKQAARDLVDNDGAGAHYDASIAYKARERLRELLGPKPSCLHEWEADGDRDVCKRCGSRTNPVI